MALNNNLIIDGVRENNIKRKVYVAGKFELRAKIKQLMTILEENDFEVTCDWTRHAPFKDNKYSSDPVKAVEYAKEDIFGIITADDLIVLYDDVKGPGTSFEMGYATANGINVYMIGVGVNSTLDYSVFVHMDNFFHYNGQNAIADFLEDYVETHGDISYE